MKQLHKNKKKKWIPELFTLLTYSDSGEERVADSIDPHNHNMDSRWRLGQFSIPFKWLTSDFPVYVVLVSNYSERRTSLVQQPNYNCSGTSPLFKSWLLFWKWGVPVSEKKLPFPTYEPSPQLKFLKKMVSLFFNLWPY